MPLPPHPGKHLKIFIFCYIVAFFAKYLENHKARIREWRRRSGQLFPLEPLLSCKKAFGASQPASKGRLRHRVLTDLIFNRQGPMWKVQRIFYFWQYHSVQIQAIRTRKATLSYILCKRLSIMNFDTLFM